MTGSVLFQVFTTVCCIVFIQFFYHCYFLIRMIAGEDRCLSNTFNIVYVATGIRSWH